MTVAEYRRRAEQVAHCREAYDTAIVLLALAERELEAEGKQPNSIRFSDEFMGRK